LSVRIVTEILLLSGSLLFNGIPFNGTKRFERASEGRGTAVREERGPETTAAWLAKKDETASAVKDKQVSTP